MVGCRPSWTYPSIHLFMALTLKITVVWPAQVVDSLVRSTEKWGAWARPPVLTPALSQTCHSPFSVHIRPCCRTATKKLLTDSGDDLLNNDLLLSSSALLFWRPSSHSGDRPSCRPSQSRGRPAGSSSRSSQSQWQPHSPAHRRVAHGRSCAPLRLLQNTNDLAALTAEVARSEPLDGWIGACLKFHHFDIRGSLP